MSQIATTIEQSKRLIAAGLDPESADMMWVVPETFDSGFDGEDENTPDPQASLKLQRHGRYCDTPAWSLSALWQMVYELDNTTYEFPTELSADELIETLVRTIIFRRENQSTTHD